MHLKNFFSHDAFLFEIQIFYQDLYTIHYCNFLCYNFFQLESIFQVLIYLAKLIYTQDNNQFQFIFFLSSINLYLYKQDIS